MPSAEGPTLIIDVEYTPVGTTRNAAKTIVCKTTKKQQVRNKKTGSIGVPEITLTRWTGSEESKNARNLPRNSPQREDMMDLVAMNIVELSHKKETSETEPRHGPFHRMKTIDPNLLNERKNMNMKTIKNNFTVLTPSKPEMAGIDQQSHFKS